MAFLGKGLKVDLQVMATEMGVEDILGLKVVELRKVILNNENFDEEFCREQLNTIIEERKRKEEMELVERKRKEEMELVERKRKEEMELAERRRKEEMELAERRRKEEMELAERKRLDEADERKRRDEMDFELQKKRIELKEGNENDVKEPGLFKIDLHKLIPKFDSKADDISLFLISFERQAKMLNLPKICWVTHLISILPSDIVGLIAREPEKDAADYEFVKKLLLQRFKLSPEKFRQLFVKHQKNLDGTWKDFYYEIRNFCEEWLNGLDINTFEDLKDLLITDQMKKKVPTEVREHFLDEWAKIKTPKVLAEKLDEYEDVHGSTKRPTVPFINKEKPYRKSIHLNTRGYLPQLEDRDVRNKEGMTNRRYVNPFNENSHQAHYNQNRITPRCYTCGKEGHFSRACRDKNLNEQNSQKNKFSSPVKAQSNVVQAEDDTKNVMTAKINTPESTCNFLAENIDKLKVIKVKCLDVVLDGTVDSGTQISVVRADLVKDIESTGEGKIKLVSAFGDSEVAPLRTFNIKIDDGLHDAVPITCAVSKKLVNDMLVCQTAYVALLENIQFCSVNARQVIDDEMQLDEIKNPTVCEVQTFEEGSCLDIEVSTDADNMENEVRSNLNSETRLKAEEEAKAVEEGRKMEEERRMNERVALEEEMRLKKERWLVEEKMRHVQDEHKMSLKVEEQKYVQEVFAEDEMFDEKEETSVDVIKDNDDLDTVILSRERMDFDENKIEEEKSKLPRRKLKNLSRVTIAELQQKVNLEASSNIIRIPLHRSVKRKYSRDKEGIEKLAWKLPDFIKRLNIMKMRLSLREREDQKTAKVKMKGVVRRLRKGEIEFQKRVALNDVPNRK